jgi:deoxyinosine 3'endonuclease (endonuclease V)
MAQGWPQNEEELIADQERLYRPGFLAPREGPLLEAAVRSLPRLPEVLLVDASGRDHPRRAGLALQLGTQLGVPTAGVTHRPLLATGAEPPMRRGEVSPASRRRGAGRQLGLYPGWGPPSRRPFGLADHCRDGASGGACLFERAGSHPKPAP